MIVDLSIRMPLIVTTHGVRNPPPPRGEHRRDSHDWLRLIVSHAIIGITLRLN